MKKEQLKIENIKRDLISRAYFKNSNISEWRSRFFVPLIAIVVIICLFFEKKWICIPFLLPAVYHIVIYIREHKAYAAQRREIADVINRGDVSIARYKLSHIATETIYEPHSTGRRVSAYKEIKIFYFTEGGSWRLPNFARHYGWSKDYYMSSVGLENISLQGDEFYYVSFAGDYDIAYIYPCKFFELDESLTQEL
ncbi:MAG: hypothetical protein IJ292_01875 [Clostridia bacterium]|nr:hypothetical protein [Clostridia bacterium]